MSSHSAGASRLKKAFNNICNTTDSFLDNWLESVHENSRFQRSKHSRFAPLRACALAAKKIQSSQEDKSQENSRWPSLGSFWLAAEDVWLFYHQARFCLRRMTGLNDRCHRSHSHAWRSCSFDELTELVAKSWAGMWHITLR